MFEPVSTLPYPGLRAFARSESMLFFGREDSVDAMIERLAATRFLAVLGASGSGKSSLVRTGLFDGLELGFFARAGARWRIVETHPGGAPMRNLAEALAQASADGDLPGDIETLLCKGRRSLIEWASGARLAPGENLLVLVDQFEEIFRYSDYAAREEAEDFVALLIESARATDLPIHIVVTMRSEYLGACALIPGLAEQLNDGFYLTPRMTRDECRRAIEGPAAVIGFDIEPALTNRILNDMAGFAPWEEERGVIQGQILSRRADQLPLMQHLLNRLWLRALEQQNAESVILTVADYEAVGGLAGALDAHGAQVLASLSDADREYAGTVFRALVSGPDPTNAVRRPCRFGAIKAELAGRPGSDQAARRIIDAFRAADCNFLQPPETVALTDDTLIDISHESLIRQWQTLAKWLLDEARASANWRRLDNALQRQRDGEGGLLQGVELQSISAWWATQGPTEIWAERHGGNFQGVSSFLAESEAVVAQAAAEAREREAKEKVKEAKERRRLYAFLVLVSILLCISVGLGYFIQLNNIELINSNGSVEKLNDKNKNLIDSIQKMTSSQIKLSSQRDVLTTQLGKLAKDKTEFKKNIDDLEKKMVIRQLKISELQKNSDKNIELKQNQLVKLKKQLSLAGSVEETQSAYNYCEKIKDIDKNETENGCKILLGIK